MKFEYLLFIAAIGMAGIGAYFSIVGIATLFGSAMIVAGIMAGVIEFSKIIGTTFLYRYWDKSMGFLKTYLCVSIFVLMMITSAGVYGFLGSAYQKSALEFKANQEKIVLVEGQKTYLVDKISQAKDRIKTLNDMRKLQEVRLSEGMTNAFLSRNPLQLKELQAQTVDMIKSADENIKTEQERIQTTTDSIQKIDQQVNDMKFSSAGKKDIRTFQFVAEQFGTSLDKVAKWFIFTLIFVFDPLAVALILAYNVVVYKKEGLINEGIPANFPLIGIGATWVTQSLKKVETIDSPISQSIFVESPKTASFSLAVNPEPVSPKAEESKMPPPRPNWL